MSGDLPSQAPRTRVFISHVHEDTQLCQPLLTALDAWSVKYWFDTKNMVAGDSVSPIIHQAISEHEIFIRICTSAMQQRPRWVETETTLFLGLKTAEETSSGTSNRRFINLILDPRYKLDPVARKYSYIDAVGKDAKHWFAELRHGLGIKISDIRDLSDTMATELSGPVVTSGSTDGMSVELLEKTLARAKIVNTVPASPSPTQPIREGKAVRPYLIVQSIEGEMPRYLLRDEQVTIQRLDHIIALNDPTVSALHATLIRERDGSYSIVDNGSANGTFVNEEKVTSRVLRGGDQIRVGTTILRFEFTAD